MNIIKQIIKTFLLLENQLFLKDKNCNKCVKEKLLLIEKLMEEIIESDKKDIYFYKIIYPMIDKIRLLEKKYPTYNINDKQIIRTMRKKIMNECFKEIRTNNPEHILLKKVINHKCNKKLLPILDVEFNLREVVKNILLLEDHLLDKRRRCMDCCKKHLLLIEAFLEEAITLSKTNKYIKNLENDIKIIRDLQKKLLKGRDHYYDIIIELKKIKQKYFDIAFNFTKKCI